MGPKGPMAGAGPVDGRGFEAVAAELNLSEAQQKEIESLRETAKAEAEKLQGIMRDNMLAERQAIEAGESEKQIRKLARKFADSRVDLILYNRKVEKQLGEILTKEQNEQLEKMKAERKARWLEHQQRKAENRSGAGSP